MADEKTWKGGRLGSFHLGRRYKDGNVGTDLGRLYEAHNVHTGAAALVLVPGQRVDWEPKESWQVRASSWMEPPHVVLEVERAPASGQLTELVEMLDVLTSAVERVEGNAQARAHLTGGPVGFLKRWAGRSRRLLRSRRGLALAGLTVLVLSGALWLRFSGGTEGSGGEARTSQGLAQEALVQADAPIWIDTSNSGQGVIAYPLPGKPFQNQAKAPCKPDLGEVEINGGCWVELAQRPPCNKAQAEYQGKCYLPVVKRPQGEPRSIHP